MLSRDYNLHSNHFTETLMAQDTVAKFLIAGAGGRHGATGNLAVRQLLARKQPMRAFVFCADERSEHLAGLAPKSSSEICTTSRRCAAPCAASLAHTSRIRSRKGCSKPLPSSRLRPKRRGSRRSSKPRRAPALAGGARPRLVRHRRHRSATAVLSRELSHFSGENGLVQE